MTQRSWGIPGWAIWSLPGRLLGSVLLIDLFAVTLVVIDAMATPLAVYPPAVLAAGTLLVGGVVHSEISLRLERVRRRVVQETAHIDLSSVWTFAAVLLVPVGMATVITVVLYLYLHFRVWRPAKSPAYRQVFTTATVVLAIHAAAGTMAYAGMGAAEPLHSLSGPLTVIAALLAYTVVNTCLVVGAVVISANKTVREVLGHGDELVLEVATLSLGALVALALSEGAE